MAEKAVAVLRAVVLLFRPASSIGFGVQILLVNWGLSYVNRPCRSHLAPSREGAALFMSSPAALFGDAPVKARDPLDGPGLKCIQTGGGPV